MGKWVAVPAMHLKPYRCIACGQTPRDDDEEGRPNLQAYFCEGVDVNWGDSVFLCGSCVRILGQLRGMIDVREADKLKEENRQLREDLQETQSELDQVNSRVDRMLDGVKAKKEAKNSRKREKVSG